MCVDGTPVEDHRAEWGLWVKREDTCCPDGPNFSKTRGVWAHVRGRPERVIGVLDTAHSQGGWAVARACALQGKACVEFYPEFKSPGKTPNEVQRECMVLGASTLPIPAGRSAVLYHRARGHMIRHYGADGYMMPNALKLPEMVTETAAEVRRTHEGLLLDRRLCNGLRTARTILISMSSGTIAAGVCRGLMDIGWGGTVVAHQGYSRPQGAVREYMCRMAVGLATCADIRLDLVDEGYSYADAARPGPTPPWPCNVYYDLKAARWWAALGRAQYGDSGPVLFWNVG